MKIFRSLSGIVTLAILTSFAGSAYSQDGKKKVLATTGMIGDLARRVAGDTVEVQELMGPGVDPHLYQPTASDAPRLAGADLVLYNGLHLEGKIVDRLEKNPRARAVTRDIPKERLLAEADQPDPHVWFDVSLWILALDRVEKDLIEFNSGNADLYRKNAAAYRKELEALHLELKSKLETVPEPQRVMITAHDAFNYFGRAYNVKVHGLQGISTDGEANLNRIRELADMMAANKVKAIFVESSVVDDGINAVIAQCKARGHHVQKAPGTLFSDAMGEPGTPEGTYPGMVRHNVGVVVNALLHLPEDASQSDASSRWWLWVLIPALGVIVLVWLGFQMKGRSQPS